MAAVPQMADFEAYLNALVGSFTFRDGLITWPSGGAGTQFLPSNPKRHSLLVHQFVTGSNFIRPGQAANTNQGMLTGQGTLLRWNVRDDGIVVCSSWYFFGSTGATGGYFIEGLVL